MVRWIAWAVLGAALAAIAWIVVQALTEYAPGRLHYSFVAWFFFQYFVYCEIFAVVPWLGIWLLATARSEGGGRVWWRWWGGAILMLPDLYTLLIVDDQINNATHGADFGWAAGLVLLDFLPLWAIWYLVRDRHRRRGTLRAT